MAAKKDKVAEGLELLAAIKNESDQSAKIKGLSKLIADAPSYVVSRAAEYAAESGSRSLNEVAAARLLKLCTDSKSDDIGCNAALSLVKLLIALEAGYEAEDAALAAIKHHRYEPVYGGSIDVAVSVRGNAAILLAAMGSKEALRTATELLAETDARPPRERLSWPARADAAKALSMIGSDGAAAVLRFKLLIGDSEPTVLSECLSGILAIDRDLAFPLMNQMLTSDNDSLAEAALLALGTWRDPRASEILISREKRFLGFPSSELYLASIAMTRQPKGIDYLLQLMESKDKRIKASALKALEPLRVLPQVAERLKRITDR